MKHGAIKTLRVGCILLAIFFLFCAFTILPQPVQATNTVTATVTSLSGPQGVAVTPNGEYAYVTNEGSGTVSVISTGSNTVRATINVGSAPSGVAVTPNGEYAYVTNIIDDSVSVINTSTNTVPTVSPSPTVPEFPAQLLIITMVVFTIIVLSVVIIAKNRITWKIQLDQHF
jgi:YVTN family beta-propeller protein